MNSFVYALLSKGKQSKAVIMGKVYDVDWKTFYMGKPKVLVAKDEDIARFEIRQMLGGKWSGFTILERRVV